MVERLALLDATQLARKRRLANGLFMSLRTLLDQQSCHSGTGSMIVNRENRRISSQKSFTTRQNSPSEP